MAERIGRFELGARLGSGAFGDVHEAVDPTSGERVALKLLKRAGPAAIARFKREFRALRDLTHRHLIRLYELGGGDDGWFYTMELIDGVDVTAWLGGGAAARTTVASGDDEPVSAAGPTPRPIGSAAPAAIDVGRLADVLIQLADALTVVHAAGRLHCDLKPGNILVDRAGQIHVCDFGLVADLGDRCDLGTPWFMAPEQVDLAPLSAATDWYAVGALLFELYAGRPPFVGDPAEVRARKCAEPAPAIATVVADVPPVIANLIDGLLARAAAHRPDGAAVRAAARALGGRDVTGPPPAPAEAPLLGRASELARLDEAWAAAGRGPVVVRVTGDSGIGKTALCRTWLAGLPPEVWALTGRCYDREHMPLRALDPVIDALAARLAALPAPARAALRVDDVGPLARLFPVLRALAGSSDDGAPAEVRPRARAAARALFARLAGHARVVIWLDDLQWSDPDSGALLAELLAGADGPPLLLLASCRRADVDTSPVLAALRAGAITVRELELAPLAADAGLALARALGRDHDAEAIAREAGGSPFLLRELALVDAAARGRAISVDELVRGRAAALSPTCRALLVAVAIAGGPVARTCACAAADGAAVPRADVDRLRAAGLIRTTARSSIDDDELDTYHDRVREAVLAGLDADARQAGHRRLAAALTAAGGDLERVARHQRDGGLRADARATARQAAAIAETPDRAAALYALAAELADDDDERRALTIARAEALNAAGRGADAATAFAEATAGAAPAVALVLRRRAAELLLRGGHLDAGRAAAAAVLAEHGVPWPASPRRVIASLLWQRARLALDGRPRARPAPASATELERIDALWGLAGALSMTDHLRGAELQVRNLRAALAGGDPIRLSRSLALEAIYSATAGGRGRARSRALIARAAELAARTADPLAGAVVTMAEGVCAHQAGEWRLARDRCADAIAALTAIPGAFFELTNANLFWLEALIYLGDVATLAAAVPRLLDDAAARGDAYALAALRAGPASFRWIAAGQPARALSEIRTTSADLPATGFHVPHLLALLAETQALLADGAGAAAWDRLDRAWPALARSYLLRAQNVLVEMQSLRGRAAIASGRPAIARAAAARIRRERVAWGDALAALLDAGAADAADAGWAAAAAACEACAMPLHARAARHHAGGGEPIEPAIVRVLAPRLRGGAAPLATTAPTLV